MQDPTNYMLWFLRDCSSCSSSSCIMAVAENIASAIHELTFRFHIRQYCDVSIGRHLCTKLASSTRAGYELHVVE